MDPQKEQVVAKAVVKEGIGANDDAARRLVEGLNSSNWREKLRASSEPQVNKQSIRQKIEQIGAERDAATGARLRPPGSESERRYNAARTDSEFAFNFLEKGYKGLSIPEQGRVERTFIDVLSQNPLIAEQYARLNPTQRAEFVQRFLTDTRYASEVRSSLTRIAEGETLTDTVSSKKDEVDIKQTELDVKKTEITDVNRRLRAVDTRLKDFSRTTNSTGANAQEIDRITGILPTLTAEIASLDQQVQNIQEQINKRERDKSALIRGGQLPDIAEVQAYDDQTQVLKDQLQGNAATPGPLAERNKRQAEILKLQQLQTEQKTLEEQKSTLAGEKSTKTIEEGKLQVELLQRQREYQDAVALRDSIERDLTEKLNGVFGEAARELLNKQIEEAEDQCDAVLDKLQSETTDERKKALLATYKKRWRGTATRFGKTRPVIKTAAVNTDWGVVMNAGNDAQEILLRAALAQTENPATNANYTVAEINDLCKDADFVKTMGGEGLDQLISRKILSGGISQEDYTFLALETEWGKDRIKRGIEGSEQLKQEVEDYMGTDALKDPNFVHRFAREMSGSKNILWLALLAGAGIAMTVGRPAEAAYKAYKQKNPYI